eukprot:TRINITY_DN39462_c0_g1_i1.p1 TRINITY_DN39462_c0_g1~~TRINITY_DN39462_c0_g1_i1.p1  ORF type:complete len:367 (+),score=74.69 TRINITY_DN39462_c0_g1_i1:115-1215(+)
MSIDVRLACAPQCPNAVLLAALVFFGITLPINAVATERALMRKDANGKLHSGGSQTGFAIDGAGASSGAILASNASTTAAEASLCKSYPGHRVVLVTVDQMYVDFFENWLLSAERHLKPEREKIVVIAEDATARPLLERLRVSPGKQTPRFDLVDDDPDIKLVLVRDAAEDAAAGEATPYGTDGFATLVNRRAKRMARFLQNDCAVLYVDVDTVWLKNPFDDIDAAGSFDLYLAEDLDASGVSRQHSCLPDDKPNFCTCFIYARPTKNALDLVSTWMIASARNGDSKALAQPQFNSALCERRGKIDYHVLPRQRYPSGGSMKSHLEKQELLGTSGPAVVHANYRIGHAAKLDFLKQNGLWALGDGK